MRSAPTLKSWMTPASSVAMLEKLALLKIASCRAPVFRRAASRLSVGVAAYGTSRLDLAKARLPGDGKGWAGRSAWEPDAAVARGKREPSHGAGPRRPRIAEL